ncbi:MAG: hypothetical protein Q9222_002564 [Ikaeria aurantiellina]
MWDTAVSAYEKETERKLATSNTVRGVINVDGLIELIEHQDHAFSGWRSRHAKLASRLHQCFKPITVLGGIAKEALSTSPYGPASSAIFGAVLHLIRAADRVSEAYDWVEQALGQLQDFPDRLNLYRQNAIDSVLEKKSLVILTCLLKVIGRCETLITRGRFRHYLHVVFLVKDEKTKKILDELNESLDKEQSYVVAASYASQKTTESRVKTLAETAVETQKRVETTVHLLEGSGKSHPSTWTIQHLLSIYGEGDTQVARVSIAYFYIKENEQQLRDPNTILKTLAWQIAEQASAFKRHAAEVCSSKKKIISAEQTWLNLFLAFYASMANIDRSTMLVIDGLDEAPRAARSALLGFFKGLLSEIAGDMDFEREEKFIEVSRAKNQQDLNRYIEDRLSGLSIIKRLVELDRLEAKKASKKPGKPQAPIGRKKLKDKISSNADGVFLWAKLLLDQIHDKDYREIEKILSRPPSSLENMVKHVYQRLSAEEDVIESIKKLLTWTAYAQRPLLFGEIELILSLPSRAPNLLLWDKFEGSFASIYEMTIPEHKESDESEVQEDKVVTVNAEESVQEAEDSGHDDSVAKESDDFSEFEGQDELDTLSAADSADNDGSSDTSDSKLLDDIEMDRGLEALAVGELSTVAGEHLHAYTDWQSKTRITFSHLQFREFLVLKKQREPIDLDIESCFNLDLMF